MAIICTIAWFFRPFSIRVDALVLALVCSRPAFPAEGTPPLLLGAFSNTILSIRYSVPNSLHAFEDLGVDATPTIAPH